MANYKFGNFSVKKTVLIVDDEEINVEIMSSILEDAFNVLKAYDGKEALDILLKEEHKVDLVLLDVFMPLDGREVLKVRQENQRLRRIPFIVCTSDKNIEKECFHLGVNDFIKKPYENPDIIVARIKRMIELYEDRSILKDVEREKLTNLYNIDFFKKYSKQFDINYPNLKKDMVLVSINHFILISELYGKDISDQILQEIAQKLLEYVSNYSGLVGIDADNEFLVYLEHQDDYNYLLEELDKAAKHVFKDIQISFKIAVYPDVEPTLDGDTIFARVKNTLHIMGNDYSKPIIFYNEENQLITLHQEELIHAFPQALKEEQFKLYFQPKYNIQGDKPVLASAEVLIRWISPKFGFVSPGEFISLFEKNGLIGKLDAYIMEKAAEYMRSWKDRFDKYIPLSVNLSRVDIFRPNIVEEIISYADSNNVPRDKFYVEITESAFVEDAKEVVPVIEKIRDNGFKIEIDDFGSGYSSFNTLVSLPFDVLKIDMEFIRSMDKNPKVKEVIKMIINLAKTMDAITVSEGVETKEQYEFLKENGCDVIQGYYFSRPLPLNEFEQLVFKGGEVK